jgi:hypothetical protein
MALTTAQQVRLLIRDIPRPAAETLYGDGTANVFALRQSVVMSANAYIPLGTALSATGVTVDHYGRATFATTISANSAVQVNYLYSVYNDHEIGNFLTAGGNVKGAGLEAVQSLMFDAASRARWAASDGGSYDDKIAISDLRQLYETLRGELADVAAFYGGVVSWSEGS